MRKSDIAKRLGSRVANLVAETAALVFVLVWITAGVPFASGVFAGEAELAFGCGIAVGLVGWVAMRRFIHGLPVLPSAVAMTLLLVAMGGLVVLEPVVARVTTGLPLTLVAVAAGAFLAAGTCAIGLAWCGALAMHDPGDVEVVALVAIAVTTVFAVMVSSTPVTATGLVVVCPLLAWALLVATRGDVLREGPRPEAGPPSPDAPAGPFETDAAKKVFHALGIFLMYFVLGFLGEFGPRGIVSQPVLLQVVECAVTLLIAVALIVWLIVLSPSVRVPATLPWAVPLAVLSVALRACDTEGTLLAGSAVFSSTLALVCFSSVTSLTEEAHDRSGRSVLWANAAPDVAIALMAGAFSLGGVFTHLVEAMFSTQIVPSLIVTLFALTALTLAPALAGYRSSAFLRVRGRCGKPADEVSRGVASLVNGAGLTELEAELLDELAHGRSLTAARNRTGDSLLTLERRLAGICRKLDVDSLAELQGDILMPLATSRRHRFFKR